MNQRGFTLIELLVVITILAAMAGLAVVALPDPNPADRVERQAQRFSDEFSIVQNRASAEQQIYGLIVNGDGFEFRRIEGWQESNGIQPPLPIWTDAFEFEWTDDVVVSGSISSIGSTPRVYILPDGFYQPDFELTLSSRSRCTEVDYTLTGNGYNAPQVARDDC